MICLTWCERWSFRATRKEERPFFPRLTLRNCPSSREPRRLFYTLGYRSRASLLVDGVFGESTLSCTGNILEKMRPSAILHAPENIRGASIRYPSRIYSKRACSRDIYDGMADLLRQKIKTASLS